MADTTATFSVNLEGNLEESAKSKADALEMLKSKLEADTQALRGMQTALSRLKGGAGTSTESIRKLKEQISGQKAALAQTQEKYINLGGALDKMKPSAREAQLGITQLTEALIKGGSPLGRFAGALSGLTLAGAVVGGLVAVAAALMAVGAAALYAGASILKYALAQADARRNDMLRLEGLSKLRNFYRESFGIKTKADSTEFLGKMLDDVSAKVPLARDQVAGLQEEFYAAGMRAGNLQAAVEGATIALSAQGERGLAQYKALAMGAAMWGKSVRDVTNHYKAQFGNIVARQMLSLDVQQRKFKESMAAMFRGLNVEKLLEAVKMTTDFFSAAGAGGKALKEIIDRLFQPIIDFIAKNGILVKRFFQGMILAALDLAIAIQGVRLWLAQTFGPNLFKGLDAGTLMVRAGEFAVYGLAAALITLSIAIGLVMIPLGIVFASFAVGSAAIFALGYGIAWLVDKFLDIRAAAIDLGFSIVKGIADGILNGIKFVSDAISKVAAGIDKVFSMRMQIHSPSKLMFNRGAMVSEGGEQGIRAGIPGIQSASEDMADASTPPAYSPVKQGMGGGGQGASVNVSFGNLELHGKQGDGSPKDFAQQIKDELVALLRGASITMTTEPV